MDNEEAKFILKAYRPSGADAGDAKFTDALQQAERDPELRAWFEREQARDKVIAAKLKGIPVPAGLRKSILAGGKVSAAKRPWWRSPGYIGLAASLALLAAVGFSVKRQTTRTDWNAVIAELVDDAAHPERHGSHGNSVKQLAALLTNPATRLSAPMNVDLGRLKADGCRTLKVGGHEVAELCFERNGAEFHLYVMKRPAGRDLPAAPQFAANKGIHSVLWADPNHLFVMASTAEEAALKALL